MKFAWQLKPGDLYRGLKIHHTTIFPAQIGEPCKRKLVCIVFEVGGYALARYWEIVWHSRERQNKCRQNNT